MGATPGKGSSIISSWNSFLSENRVPSCSLETDEELKKKRGGEFSPDVFTKSQIINFLSKEKSLLKNEIIF